MGDGWVVNREGIWRTREKWLGDAVKSVDRGKEQRRMRWGGIRDGGGWVINGNE